MDSSVRLLNLLQPSILEGLLPLLDTRRRIIIQEDNRRVLPTPGADETSVYKSAVSSVAVTTVQCLSSFAVIESVSVLTVPDPASDVRTSYPDLSITVRSFGGEVGVTARVG